MRALRRDRLTVEEPQVGRVAAVMEAEYATLEGDDEEEETLTLAGAPI